jgi:hypothetical protein
MLRSRRAYRLGIIDEIKVAGLERQIMEVLDKCIVAIKDERNANVTAPVGAAPSSGAPNGEGTGAMIPELNLATRDPSQPTFKRSAVLGDLFKVEAAQSRVAPKFKALGGWDSVRSQLDNRRLCH